MLLFALLFRMAIYLLDVSPLSGHWKLALSIAAGVALIATVLHLYLDIGDERRLSNAIYLLAYLPPFAVWSIRRNIWGSIRVEKEEAGVLDDVDFE